MAIVSPRSSMRDYVTAYPQLGSNGWQIYEVARSTCVEGKAGDGPTRPEAADRLPELLCTLHDRHAAGRCVDAIPYHHLEPIEVQIDTPAVGVSGRKAVFGKVIIIKRLQFVED